MIRETKKSTVNGEMAKKIKTNFTEFFMDDDVLMEILKRLNATVLVRFRCVSKHWDRMIRQPYFADLHHRFLRSLPHTLLLSLVDTKTFYFYEIDENGRASYYFSVNAFDLGFNTIDCVSDVVNGLVCISNYNRVAVCNITNCETVWLPKTRRKSFKLATPLIPGIRKRSKYIPHYSFGFDPSTNKYKVLRIWVNSLENFVRCELFTIATSKYWREIEINVLPTNYLNAIEIKSICIDGCLYWLMTRVHPPFQVIMFDFSEEKFRTIDVPESVYKSMKGEFSPIQVGGRFGIRSSECVHVLDEEKEGWMRKDLDFGTKYAVHVGSSETRQFFLEKVHYRSITGSPSLSLLCMDHNGAYRSSIHITGSLPVDARTALVRSPNFAITEHVENMYPLARI